VCIIATTERDFTEQGFDCVMEFLHTAKVRNVTCDAIDTVKLKAAVQCAEFLGVLGLDESANEWAKQCGVDL
jgi:hypothetical protein